MTGDAINVTRTLAEFVVASRFADLPDHVVHEAKRALLHWIGCAVGGSHEQSVDSALAAVKQFSGPPQASVFGRSERLDVLHAAFVNGVSTDVLSFSDTHPETLIHPTGVLGPALAAMAEQRPISGKQLLHALILGFDVASRVSLAIYPWHYDRGWHITGTAGAFGAGAAAGKILGLDAERIVWTLGISATAAAGLRGMFGSMCKNFHSGRAAENGLLAAFLAQNGFNSVPDGIGGPRCFAHVLGESPDLEAVVRNLGETYEITKNTYKAYPCGVVIHPVIDACVQIAATEGFDPAKVATVEIRGNPFLLELTGRKTPTKTLEGKLSVFHSAAAALIARRIGEQEFADAFIQRCDVIALRDKVTVQPDAQIREDEAHVSVKLGDGRTLRQHIEHATGTAERPMSDREIESKFRGLCEPYLQASQIASLIGRCWNITDVADAATFAQLARVNSQT
jgi:2-methylcitrate dehydratase PrpD